MSLIQSSPLLRNALALDAVACACLGLILAPAAEALAAPLGLPLDVLRGAGLMLLPCAALIGWLASRKTLPRLAVQAVIGVNLLWIVDSVAILLTGWFAPTGLGIAFVLVQAAAVVVVTELEVIGFKRSGAIEPAGEAAVQRSRAISTTTRRHSRQAAKPRRSGIPYRALRSTMDSGSSPE